MFFLMHRAIYTFAYMELRIFTLPFDGISEGFPDEIITQFCLNKKVHSIVPQFFEQEGRPFWSVAVQYEVVLRGEDKVRALDDAQQLLFARLKEWRKNHAVKVGIPVYLICTNAQLLQMVQLKCRSLESLKQVLGFGRKRTEKYGKPIVDTIKDFYDEKRKQGTETATPAAGAVVDDLPFD